MTNTSTNDRAEQLMGRRDEDGPVGVILFSPAEQGYRCPVHTEQCINDDTLHWSEYRAFLWCELCDKDYPSALCCTDIDRGIDVFLESVSDALIRSLARHLPRDSKQTTVGRTQ